MNEVLFAGLDLCEDYTQLTCYNERQGEPESIGTRGREEQYLIPTCLAVKRGSREWVTGEEAERLVAADEAVSAGDLLRKAEEGEATVLYDTEFQPEELLQRFLRRVLLLLQNVYQDQKIRCLVVTVPDREPERQEKLKSCLMAAFSGLGLEADRVRIQNHTASFLQYTIHQKKELWQNDTAVFEFQGDGLFYRQLAISRRENPMVAAVTERDFSDRLTLAHVEENPEAAAGIFAEAAEMALYRKLLSTVYAVGRGFEGDWADGVLMSLCAGRRVFKGQNLYAKGACYAAKAFSEGKADQVLLLGDDRISAQVSINVYRDGQIRELVLVPPASLWQDAGGSFDMILDQETELCFQVKDFVTKKQTEHFIPLEGLPERGERMTRIRLKVTCTDRHSCLVRVKDLGFGEFVKPAEGRVWETVLQV